MFDESYFLAFLFERRVVVVVIGMRQLPDSSMRRDRHAVLVHTLY